VRRKTIRDESKTLPLSEVEHWWVPMSRGERLWLVLCGGLLAVTLIIVALSFLGGGG
jgi:hypothetical protein